MDFEKDLLIDETALDVEWLNQSALAAKWIKHWVYCKNVCTRAEERIKVVKAQLTKLAYEGPDKYLGSGIKPTGATLEAFYRTNKKHIKAKNAWMDALHELEIAEIAKSQISYTRKTALENLVKLHGQQYFAGPSVPRNLEKEAANKRERTKSQHINISRKLKKDGKKEKE